MKKLKLHTGILIMICLSVITACNDNITSSLNTEPRETNFLNSGNYRGDSFSSSFILNPGEHIFLDTKMTSLIYIDEYSISNCGLNKKDLHITASNIDGLQSLPCSSTEYFLFDLMIENRSGQARTIDVILHGSSK